MSIKTTINYNDKDYTVDAELASVPKIVINGVRCTNVIHNKDINSYYALVPEDDRLVVITYLNKAYIYERSDGEDMDQFVKKKLSRCLNRLELFIMMIPTALLSFFLAFSYYKKGVDLFIIATVVLAYAVLTKGVEIVTRIPELEKAVKRSIAYVAYIVTFITYLTLSLISIGVV